MKRYILFAALLLSGVTQAQDMEALLEGKAETQTRRNQSFLADTVRSLLGNPTQEQNFFLRHVEDGHWVEALIQYGPAFNNTAFESTETGIALKGLMFFKSGMPVTGLEELFVVQDPKKIHFQLINEWREAAKEDNKAWFVARIKWSQGSGEIFGRVIEVRVLAADLSLKRSVDELNTLECCGYDIAEPMIVHAEDPRNSDRLRFTPSWHQVEHFASEKPFDLVIMAFVLHDDFLPYETLNMIKQVIRAGGRIGIIDLSTWDLPNLCKALQKSLISPTVHDNRLDPAKILRWGNSLVVEL